ncbi:MAG: hypothetical protein EAZ15_03810 [Sphingobacteriales bacterium]|nr:MAG: hypothetical protein EAZ15_03810 [Sphingobacteriales bacterium]
MINRIATKCLALILFFSIVLSFVAKAQFGNEWIKPTQKYVKIKITAQGLYSINFTQISQAGLISNTVDPKKFQLFNKGKQVALMVSGNQTTFTNTDIITFYGEPNNASLDKSLYRVQNDLPNEEVSLFEDANYYFLTYSETENGLRYQNQTISNVGLTPEPYLVYKSRLNFATNYYPGRYILASMSLSEYIAGEGFLGDTYSKGESQTHTLNTPNFAQNTNLPTTTSFYTAGRSDSKLGIQGSANHHFKILVNNIVVTDTLFREYDIVKHKKNVALGNLQASTTAVFSSVNDLSTVPNFTDFQAPAYVEIIYPRLLNLSGVNTLNFSLNTTQVNAYLKFTNSNIPNAIILDNSNNTYYNEVKTNGNSDFVINSKPNTNYYLTNLNNTNPVVLEAITFKNFKANDFNPYLIVSNKLFSAGADAYKSYNENQNLPTLIAYVDDLYNEFYYGFHHPLAIKNFVNFGLNLNVPAKPVYLFLLGNGTEYPKTDLANDFVPTMGFPPSDNMLTSGLNGSNLEPGLLTGRLPVTNNIDINNYLDKIKTYNLLPDSLWRKNFIHVSGGTTQSENDGWAGYQNNFFTYAKETSFGGKVSVIRKNVSTPITENKTERIIKETNQGIGLLSYFGHGASTGTEISFGEAKNYNNKNKTPFYVVNGCSTADVFSTSNSLAEQFLLQKDLGGLAWIGTTSLGVASYLFGATNIFYKNWFQEYYGEAITKGIQKGLRQYQQNGDDLNLAHVRQYIFIGDPALKFYAPAKADLQAKNAFLFPSIPNQNASLNSLSLKLKIENPGKAVADSVVVKVTRTLADNSVIEIPIYKIKPVYHTDTIAIELSNQGIVAAGNNKITVLLDPQNKITELNENNNQASIDVFLPGNGVNLLYPINNGIVGTNTVSLEAQPDNLYTKNAEYIFEIDTLISFNSPFFKTSGIMNVGLLPKWQPSINFEAGKVYYWRARLNLDFNKGGAWSNASFTYLPNVVDGRSFSHKSQMQNLNLKNISYDVNTGKFNFITSLYFTNIQTRGDDASTADEKRLRVNIQNAVAYGNPEFTGFSIATFNNNVFGELFSYPSIYNRQSGPNLINGYSGQYFWDINDPIQLDSMVSYINQIPNGYYVLGLNGFNAALNLLPAYAKNALRSVGLVKYNLINNGEPYMFWGIKGAAAGAAEEFTADYTSSTPARSQLIKFTKAYNYVMDNGVITSENFGPAKSWKTAQFDFNKIGGDAVKYTLVGVEPNGLETNLFTQISTTEIDLTNISALTYPYLKIKAEVSDKVEKNAADLKHLRIIYQPVTELTFNPEFKDIFKDVTLQEGDSTKWEIGVTNLSNYESEPMSVNQTIFKSDKSTITKTLIPIPKLLPRTSISIKLADATKGLGGKNNLKLQFQTQNQFDLYRFNNVITKDYNVNKDVKEPLVNVVFDGKSIINGEIVSPQPVINITTIDDNKFLLLGDTALVEVFIKKQDETKYSRLSYGSSQLKIKPSTNTNINKSTIEYIAKSPFEDGTYTLKVRSKDASGNYNTANDYTIDFECINKSEITNFYPYPNPCTTSMRFVFTLTGMKIPDDIKITIFTATGKVVREVFKNELGNIRSGNNISDFAWDGTDQFGDRLANGVYFYKVTIKNYDDAQIGRRITQGDNMFKKNMGKIYLLK